MCASLTPRVPFSHLPHAHHVCLSRRIRRGWWQGSRSRVPLSWWQASHSCVSHTTCAFLSPAPRTPRVPLSQESAGLVEGEQMDKIVLRRPEREGAIIEQVASKTVSRIKFNFFTTQIQLFDFSLFKFNYYSCDIRRVSCVLHLRSCVRNVQAFVPSTGLTRT